MEIEIEHIYVLGRCSLERYKAEDSVHPNWILFCENKYQGVSYNINEDQVIYENSSIVPDDVKDWTYETLREFYKRG